MVEGGAEAAPLFAFIGLGRRWRGFATGAGRSFRARVPIQRLRRAFTLIETVFAIFIFSVGTLGLAATTAVVIRSLGQSAARERAAKMASSRLEILRSLACGKAQNGSEAKEGVESMWTISLSGDQITAVSTVTYPLNGTARTESYSALFPCRR